MKKITIIALFAIFLPSYAQEKGQKDTVLEDADYERIAQQFWGSRNGNWRATDPLKHLIHEVDDLSKECSENMKWVPLPAGAPPGASELVKYAWRLRSSQQKILRGDRYRSCVNFALSPRRTMAEETQDEQYN